MSYVQRPIPHVRSLLPPGIAMRRPTYPRMGHRHHKAILGDASSFLPKLPGLATSTASSIGVATGAIAAGSAISIALPVIGIALGAIFGSLWAAHEARIQGAKTENALLNSLIPTVISAVQAVFTALSNGTATPAQGIAALQAIWSQYWQEVSQVETGPGQAGGASQCVTKAGAGLHITGTSSVQNPPGSNFSGYGPVAFNRSCTASCGVGCMWVASWVNTGIALINAGGGTVTFDGVVGNKYGLSNTSPLTITYKPPAAGSASAAVSNVASSVASLAGGTIFGLPIWGVALVVGVGIWAVSR
jgi:hypothetical protein